MHLIRIRMSLQSLLTKNDNSVGSIFSAAPIRTSIDDDVYF